MSMQDFLRVYSVYTEFTLSFLSFAQLYAHFKLSIKIMEFKWIRTRPVPYDGQCYMLQSCCMQQDVCCLVSSITLELDAIIISTVTAAMVFRRELERSLLAGAQAAKSRSRDSEIKASALACPGSLTDC